ncbi:MAG: acyl-CoA dehydratase activase-related protein [Promethearchaeota archaeon]
MVIKTLVSDSLQAKKERKAYKVGIPRALYFYKYGPLWKSFLESLNCQVFFSGLTNNKIVESGAKDAQSEFCVPMKIYFGHVKALIDENPDLDYVFIPRYVSSEKEQFFCPKFMILPESIKYGIKFSVPILTLEINAKKSDPMETIVEFGKNLGYSENETKNAWKLAEKEYKKFKFQARSDNYIKLINGLDPNPDHKESPKSFKQIIESNLKGKFPLNILLLGHAYNVYETHINLDLIGRLNAMDCNVYTIETMPDEIFKERVTINQQYHQYWQSEDEILKTARYFLTKGRDQVDGVIFLISFSCGPDSLIEEIVMRDMKLKKIPYLSLVLDEHSGESGLVTRIESLVDMIRRKKYN